MLEELMREVCAANKALYESRLVVGMVGNVSGRDRRTEYVVIKPEGVSYPEMKPEDMVVTDLAGGIVEGKLKPSGYLMSHLAVYKEKKDIGGIAHTHSNYATCYAALGKPMPCYLMAQAANFGGAIPVTKPADMKRPAGIGEALLKVLERGERHAALLLSHGVFTFGKNAAEAVNYAVLLEDMAKTSWLAESIGKPIRVKAK